MAVVVAATIGPTRRKSARNRLGALLQRRATRRCLLLHEEVHTPPNQLRHRLLASHGYLPQAFGLPFC